MKLLTSDICFSIFGHPMGNAGMQLWGVPQELQQGKIPHRIYCNKALIIPLRTAFFSLISTGAIDELESWDGCYNVRKSKGGNFLSLHSWGLAVDVNASTNQYGKQPTLSEHFINCFTAAGFHWGGEWSVPDGMHFQLKPELLR